MRILSPLLLTLLLALTAGVAPADTYVVHPNGTGDFPTIQEAVDAAVDGDVVELADGTFNGDGNRDVDYLGKAITIESQSGNPATCIIDCEGTEELPHRAFLFQSGEPEGTLLSGVTITNGWIGSQPMGGVVLCIGGSSPTIRSCIFTGNRHSAIFSGEDSSPEITECVFSQNHGRYGGAIYSQAATITISDCEFLENSAEMIGGAYHAHGGSGIITNCSFIRNTAVSAGAIFLLYGAEASIADCWFEENSADTGGGALNLHGFGQATVERCTFVANSASEGAAMETSKMSYAHLSNCTFWGNVAWNGSVLFCGEQEVTIANSIIAFSPEGRSIACGNPVTLSCVDIYGNAGGDWVDCIADQYGVNGNISEDPLFCDPAQMDFTLRSDSPCAEENNPECGQIGAWPVGCDVPVPVERRSWGRMKGVWVRR